MIIYGRNAILESLKANKAVFVIYAHEGQKTKPSEILALAHKAHTKVNFVDKATLNNLAKTEHHQGYVAEIEDYAYCEIEDILALAQSKGQQPFVVMLDGVEDPHNLGSILRVCECAGVHGVIIPKYRACPINETVAKTSAGALGHILISRVSNLNNTIKKLKQNGMWVYAVELGGDDIYKQNLQGDLCLVVGSEGDGISQLVKKNCDGILTLPMFGKVNSLNASVACGVAVFEAVRQRRKNAG
ncbi:MAG: 23S rRNA (guanosine(2251)-2'-O)-methyltransferase RlmB [Clostridia bacterium]|nr:23S rRNA (guanosine(2251)-2'-O)-methyltransferase RlmB [Clostridia bacterium]